ncbi:MAG: peptidyl-alpha-hydroxyglycine alpha-amidating lyase family protein [Cellvibrionaceae bacterium]
MSQIKLKSVIAALAVSSTFYTLSASAQLDNPNVTPNPYSTVPGIWAKLPDDRKWGATSTVYYAGNGKLWAAERCGDNRNCLDTPDIDPILLIDTKTGNIEKTFGKNLIVWPHGIHVDHDGNVWIADARGDEKRKKGHQVHKFSPDGKLLMSLGKAGIAGNDEYTFDQPCDVAVAANGDIFIADGHSSSGNNRIVKYNKEGKFIKQFGTTGSEDGELRVPHALAMDSEGRLFVADRSNGRLQIFDQDGNHIDTWTQFGRPSGLYIDKNDILYSADSESNTGPRRNPGWYRGIRIGSAKEGFVTAFIPDPNSGFARGTSAAEGVTADEDGNVYGAEVLQRALRKYVPKK